MSGGQKVQRRGTAYEVTSLKARRKRPCLSAPATPTGLSLTFVKREVHHREEWLARTKWTAVTEDVAARPLVPETYDVQLRATDASGVPVEVDGVSNDFWRQQVPADTDLRAVFHPLPKPKTYYFQTRIRVLNRVHGGRCWSAWTGWTTPTQPSSGALEGPPAPSGLTLQLLKDAPSGNPWRARTYWNRTGTWTPAGGDALGGAKEYRLEMQVSASNGGTVMRTLHATVVDPGAGTTAEFSFDAVRGKRWYRSRVAAVSQYGALGAFSSPTSWASPRGDPDPPTNIAVDNPLPRVVRVTWDPPADLTDVDRFKVRIYRTSLAGTLVETRYAGRGSSSLTWHVPSSEFAAHPHATYAARVNSIEDPYSTDVDDVSTGTGAEASSSNLDSGTVTDSATIPFADTVHSDGSPPASSPTPTVLGGPDFLFAKWTAVANVDPVTYEVHVSAASGFTPDGTTLWGQITGTMAFIKTLPDASALAVATTYYVKLIAKDADGSAAAGTQGSAQLVALPSSKQTSDGAAPGSSPTPTLNGSLGVLVASWTPVANNDLVTYAVHLSAASGFTPDGGTLVGYTTGTSYVFRKTSGGSDLAYGTTYYCKLIATDADGSAAAGAQGSAALVQVAAADITAATITATQIAANTIMAAQIAAGTITANEIAAATITAAKIAAGTITANEIAAASILGSNIAAGTITASNILAGSITADHLAATLVISTLFQTGTSGNRVEFDVNGIRCYDASNNFLVNIPTDGSPVYISGQIAASSLLVTGNAELRGTANSLGPSSVTALQSGITNPQSPPALSQTWDSFAVTLPAGVADYRADLGYSAAGGAGGATHCFYAVFAWGGTYLAELLASDGSINRTALLHATDTVYGIVAVDSASAIYALCWTGSAWKVRTFAISTLAAGTVYTISSVVTNPTDPKIAWDSGADKVYVCDVDASSSHLKWQLFTTLMATSGGVIDAGVVSGLTDPIALYVGNADFGALRIIVADYAHKLAHSFNSAAAEQSNESFSAPAFYGLVYDGTRFFSGSHTYLSKHSTWTWTSASAIYWVAYAWHDSVGTTHSSQVGPRASITMGRRKRLDVTTAAVPGIGGVDDPNTVDIYFKPNATDPGLTNLKYQGEFAGGGTMSFRTYDGAGAADPGSNGFAALGVPAELKSANGEWDFKGNGIFALFGTRPLCWSFYDEFIGYNGTKTAAQDWGQWLLSITGGGSILPLASEASHPGILQIGTSTGTTDHPRLTCQAPLLAQGRVRFGGVARIVTKPSTSNNFNAYAGFSDTASPIASSNQVEAIWSRVSDTVMQLIGTNDNGSGTPVQTTLSSGLDTNFHRVECEINAAGTSLQWYLDGVATGAAVTTKIPTATMQQRIGILKSGAGATARQIDVDAFYAEGELTTAR